MRAALDKKKLRREIEQNRRTKAAEHLAELRDQLKAARGSRREAIEKIRLQCRKAREKLRTTCGARKDRARREGDETIDVRRRELKGERALEKLQRTSDRRRSPGPVGRVRSARREREEESDDEVRRNLAPDLARVFDHVRRQIRGSDYKSRTESFLQWAEENPGEVYRIQERDAAQEVKRLLREHQRDSAARELEDVPF